MKDLRSDRRCHHVYAGHIDDRRRCQAKKDRRRDGTVRVVHLLGHAGHLQGTGERDEDEPHRRDEALHSEGHEGLERALRSRGATEHRDKSLQEKQDQESEHSADQDSLQAAGVLRSDHVHEGEGQCQHDGHSPNRKMDEESKVRPHSHEGEGALEDEHEPGAETADGPHHRPEAAVEEVVDSACPGHRGRKLRDAERGGDGKQTREEVGQHDGRSRHRSGKAREQEEAGAEHRPETDHVDVEKGQLLLESMTGGRGGGSIRWWGSTGHSIASRRAWQSREPESPGPNSLKSRRAAKSMGPSACHSVTSRLSTLKRIRRRSKDRSSSPKTAV